VYETSLPYTGKCICYIEEDCRKTKTTIQRILDGINKREEAKLGAVAFPEPGLRRMKMRRDNG